jgi:uncharacterized protein
MSHSSPQYPPPSMDKPETSGNNAYPPPPSPPGSGQYQGGYQQNGGIGSNGDEKVWAILAHLGGVFFSWLVPLVIMLVMPKEKSPYAHDQAKEAFNFQVTLFIGYLISGILMFVLIGFVTVAILYVYSLVYAIIAAIKVSEGQNFRYPFALRIF